MSYQDADDFMRYRWLSAIGEHLSPPAREIWKGFEEQFGEQEHLDRLRWTTKVTWGGERSPVSKETLASWSVADIVRYCSVYTGPEESFDRDSKEGLADALTQTVQSRPREFAANAMEFIAFAGDQSTRDNPRYVESLFSGLEQCVRATSAKSEQQDATLRTMAAVLSPAVTELIGWVMERETKQHAQYVPTWEGVRRAAAHLLVVCLEKLSELPASAIGSILKSNGESLFNALRSLQNAEDPELENEPDDPLNLSINCTRGIALLAVVTFQQCWDIWNRSTEDGLKSGSRLHPRVSDLLEERLKNEVSPSVRCVFGWRLPYLHNLSAEWVTRNLNDIFPQDDARESIWHASWDAYIAFNRLYSSIWDLLVPYYRRAVVEVGRREYKQTITGPGGIDARLGDHIFLAWFAGYREAESLLMSFIKQSDDELRSHIVQFGSRVLETNVTGKRLSEESPEWRLLERFWRERVSREGALGIIPCGPSEAVAFVHWLRFSPAKLPRLKPLIDPLISRFGNEQQNWEATLLLEYLCDQSMLFPLDAAELIADLAEKAWPQWLRQEQVERVISALKLAKRQPNGSEVVKRGVDRLALNHHYEYRGVLEDCDDEQLH